MYCCFSKLRTDDMTLKDIAEILEVSQSDIASAVGIAKSTVNNYINEPGYNPETLDKIYKYLNSREFYNGYSFMPTKKFAKLLDSEILDVFRNTMKQKEIAEAIGMTPQKLCKLLNSYLSNVPENKDKENNDKETNTDTHTTQKLNIREQYNILEKFYNMCIEFAPGETDGYIDDNNKITNEFVKLRIKLRDYIRPFDAVEIRNGFSALLNYIADKGFKHQLYGVLKEICGIDDYKDYKRVLHDDEFIMDLEARYCIIYELDKKIGIFSSELHEKLELILEASDNNEEWQNEDFRQVDFTPLYKYPDIIGRIILEHCYAFVDDAKYCMINQYEKGSFERNYALWHHSWNVKNELHRIHMVEEYHKLSVNSKISVCKDFAGKISEHMKQAGAEITPLKAEFDENGKLLINTNYIYCRKLSDINGIMEIVSRIGPLENLLTDFTPISLDNEYPFENRNYFFDLMSDMYSNGDGLEEILDKKLEFDAMDWNLWYLITQALYIGRSIEDISEQITKLSNDKKRDKSITL